MAIVRDGLLETAYRSSDWPNEAMTSPRTGRAEFRADRVDGRVAGWSPKGLPPTPTQTARSLVDALTARHVSLRRPVFVALDGRSGAGKSTLATAVAESCRSHGITVTVTVIAGDDFYAGGSAELWDQRSLAEKAQRVIDWQRQYRLLEVLRLRGHVSWYPFDWEAVQWDADVAPLRSSPMSATSADIVIVEGVYSARPELHDVLDILVLLDTPPEQRRLQLVEREGDHYRTEWEARWSAAEDHYFGVTMPPHCFDLVL